jgi:hypothetical protein
MCTSLRETNESKCMCYKYEDDGCFWNDATHLQALIVPQLEKITINQLHRY